MRGRSHPGYRTHAKRARSFEGGEAAGVLERKQLSLTQSGQESARGVFSQILSTAR